MIVYLFRCIGEILATIIAYFTNPIVVLFCDEYGNLPKIFKYWQTYDNPCDIDWIVDNHVWKIFKYNFRKHYFYHPEVKGSLEEFKPGYVDLLDPKFTIIERIQRYFCRLRWLYRNCNYGFTYYVNGWTHRGTDLVPIKSHQEEYNDLYYAVDKDTNRLWWNGHFCIWVYKKWCKWFSIRIYLGWKCKYQDSDPRLNRNMLAFFIWPFRKNKRGE